MLEVLEFIFKDIWHFLGTAVLLGILSQFSFVRIYHVDDTKESKDKNEKKDEKKDESK